MEDQLTFPDIQLTVPSNTLDLFTTLLQSGIEVKTTGDQTLGEFLFNFPGFTGDYLAETVQTIFLNGTAVDDLTLTFNGDTPVLALSAAMPGLAGAIFRKNSFHSALRTDTGSASAAASPRRNITVTLKLFNSIARERGTEMLRRGVCVKSAPLISFLNKREQLLSSILTVRSGDRSLSRPELMAVLHENEKINLHIVGKDE
ncbi:MAG: hypothetical protein ACWGOX_05825 [Desulforhopalus sp.]